MIKVNDLKIGNWFIDNEGAYCNKGDIVKVINISEYGVNEYHDMGASGRCHFEMAEPIILTKEWLLKFGFSEYIRGGRDIVFQRLAGSFYSVIFESNKISFTNNVQFIMLQHIKFVHQLQNLFFCITGEELLKVDFMQEKY